AQAGARHVPRPGRQLHIRHRDGDLEIDADAGVLAALGVLGHGSTFAASPLPRRESRLNAPPVKASSSASISSTRNSSAMPDSGTPAGAIPVASAATSSALSRRR